MPQHFLGSREARPFGEDGLLRLPSELVSVEAAQPVQRFVGLARERSEGWADVDGEPFVGRIR